LLHAGLAGLFATSADPSASLVQPFALDDLTTEAKSRPDQVYLLGYSSLSERELVERMGPAREGLLREIASRAVPPIEAGTRCSFRVRICPVVRTKHPGEHSPRLDKKGRTMSREVDAWLAHRLKSWEPDPPRDWETRFDTWADRTEVYRQWLGRELSAIRTDAHPAIVRSPATLEGAEMVELFREPFRRKGERKQASPLPGRRRAEHPNAVLEGHLRVADTEGFRALLTRGVGRHRAFGFGMLLVRPA
jgi:CRISPR system Cascade subunit CasE